MRRRVVAVKQQQPAEMDDTLSVQIQFRDCGAACCLTSRRSLPEMRCLVMPYRFESELFDQFSERDIAQFRKLDEELQPLGVGFFNLICESF